MTLDDAGLWTLVAQLTGLIAFICIVALWMAGVAWVANDIRRRTEDQTTQWLSIGAAALLFVPGVILYVAMRPTETLEERRERFWETEWLAQQAHAAPMCGTCQRLLREDFVRCPYCGASLGQACADCGRFNRSEWVTCPYCGVARSNALVTAQAAGGGRAAVRKPRPAAAMAMSANGRRPAG